MSLMSRKEEKPKWLIKIIWLKHQGNLSLSKGLGENIEM